MKGVCQNYEKRCFFVEFWHTPPFLPQQRIRILLNLVHELLGIVGVLVDECLYYLACLLAVVACKERREPVAGEEDVACTLHVDEDVESGSQVGVVEWLARAVVEQAQHGRCPGLYAAVFGLEQRLEELLLGSFVGGAGSGYEVELAQLVLIGYSGTLRMQNLLPLLWLEYGESVGYLRVVGLREQGVGLCSPYIIQ